MTDAPENIEALPEVEFTRTLKIPEFGATLLMLVRQWKLKPGTFPASMVFMDIPVGADRWHASLIEGGVMVTHEINIGIYSTGETEKYRAESEMVSYSRRRNDLARAINERKGHIAAKTQEIEQIRRMVGMKEHEEDINLTMKLVKFENELSGMEAALDHWQKELEPIAEKIDELKAKLECAQEKMDAQRTESWKLMDDETVEVEIIAY